MTKKSYFHFRITPDEKERWQKFADEHFDGALAKLVRSSVTGYINGTNQGSDNTEILEKLQMVIDKFDANTITPGGTVATADDLIKDDSGNVVPISALDPETEYKEVDKPSGKYDF